MLFYTAEGSHPTNNVLGWLWGGTTEDSPGTLERATGLGWVSSDNTTPGAGGGPGYGLNIPPDTCTGSGCDVTGYAWSSNVGWIDFQPSSPYPGNRGNPSDNCGVGSCPNFPARRNGNNLEGWARIVSIAQAGLNSGGWEGWIKLRGPNYGVTITNDNPPKVTDYGWSPELGWVNFLSTTLGGGGGSLPSGQITANPNPCDISPGGTVCSSNISWSSTNAANPEVRYSVCTPTGCGSESQFGTGISGSQYANFIEGSPKSFDFRLYHNPSSGPPQLLANVVVTGRASGVPSTPSCNLIANPGGGRVSFNTDLQWTTSNCSSDNSCVCNGSGGLGNWAINNPKSIPTGSETVSINSAGLHQFTLTCRSNVGIGPSCSSTVNATGGGVGDLRCSGSPNPAYLSTGGRVTWSVQNGTGPFDWTFDGGANPVRGSGRSFTVTYSQQGTKNARVTDLSNNDFKDCSTVQVKDRFRLREIIPFF